MATPTFAEVGTQIKNLVDIYDTLKTNGATYLTKLDTYLQSLEGDQAPLAANQEQATRSSLAGLLRNGAGPVNTHFTDWAKAIASPQTGVAALLNNVDGDMFQYFIDNSQSVKERNINFGALVASGSLAGESLSETNFATHTKWDVTGDFTDSTGAAVYTHSTGVGTLTQTQANLTIAGVALRWYRLDYTVSSPSGDAAIVLTTGFAEEQKSLDMTAGAHSLYFRSNGSPANFVLSGTSGSGGVTLDDLSLKQITGMIGNGHVKRLITDRNSQDMEAVSMTAKKIYCVQDSNSGTKVTEELFAFEHSVNQNDELDATAFSPNDAFPVAGPENSLITNGSFQSLDGTVTSLSSIPGWTVTTAIANLNYDATNFFASSPTERDAGTDKSYALKFLTNDKITQSLRTEGKSIDPSRPYTFFLWYNRSVGSGDGTLTIRMGSKTASVVLSAQTGWNLLEMTLDQTLWYSAFKEDDFNLEVELSGRTTGTLLIDFVTFAELSYFDGSYWIVQPGSTPFQKGDSFTVTDALTGSDGKIQSFLAQRFGVYAPHAASPTITDPA